MQRGIPNVVWQPTLTGNAATLAKGTLKKASLLNGSFGVFAASVYDNKPVHLMTTAYTDSTWIMKERKWYQSGKVSVRVYRRLLLIDLYNQFMDGVDLKDQLCWYYRFFGKHMWRTQYVMRTSIVTTGGQSHPPPLLIEMDLGILHVDTEQRDRSKFCDARHAQT